MSDFSYFVLVTLLAASLLSILFSFKYKKNMTAMASMAITMAIGMNIGMTSGIYFGFMYQGDLFLSTLISILTGVLAGVAAGIPLGILPVIEGFMAGMMGGMMGAMLGDMVSEHRVDSLLNIFLTISVSTLFLYFVLSKEKSAKENEVFTKWLLKPVFIFIILFAYFYYGNQLSKELVITKKIPNMLTEQITIKAHTSDFFYSPNEIILSKNKKFSLTFVNHDLIEHEILIKGMPILPVSNQDNHSVHNHQAEEIHLHAGPHEEEMISFTPTKAGKYEFYCSIPGHKEKGMVGFITVK